MPRSTAETRSSNPDELRKLTGMDVDAIELLYVDADERLVSDLLEIRMSE